MSDGRRSRSRWIAVAVIVLVIGGLTLWRARSPEVVPVRKMAAVERAPGFTGREGAEAVLGGVIEGRVVDPDGRPVAGAAVTAAYQWRREDLSSTFGRLPSAPPVGTRSGADGGFRLPVASAGSHVLAASAPGFMGVFRGGVEVAPRATVKGLELRLARGGLVLSGRLFDAGGGAIAGGRLRALVWERPAANPPGARYAFEATADGDGHYRLQLPPGRYGLEAEADGYAPARDFTDLTAAQSKDFRLEPAARLAGRVLTASDRRAVAGAEVSLSSAERRHDLSVAPVFTDDEGAFQMEGLPSGSFSVTARKGALVATAAQPIVLAAGGRADVEIAVSPGLTVAGTVKSADGAPVAGAQVSLVVRTRGSFGMAIGARTEASGRFSIPGVLPGEYGIAVVSEGRPSRMDDISVHASVTRDFVLENAARVTGVVLTSGGQRAAGARLEAWVRADGAGRMATSDRTSADAQGRFTLTRLGPGRLTIGVQQGSEAVRVEDQPLATGEQKEMTIKLQPGGRVSGVVVWDDGAPAADLKVIGMYRGGGRGESEVLSAADGSFTLGPFSAGQIAVVVMPPGERTGWSSMARPEQADLELGGGEHRTGVKLVASKRSGLISGSLIGPSGQPIAGASVVASMEREGRAYKRGPDGARTVTGPDGAFTLEALKNGTYTLWAISAEHPEIERSGIAAGTRDVRLQAGRGASLSGVFVDGGGRPIPSYTLVVVPPGKDDADARFRRATDDGKGLVVSEPRGAFAVDRLSPGLYELVASAADGRSARLSVSVTEGEKKRGVRLVAETGILVSGRVLEYESGQPLAGMQVRIRAATAALEATTDAQGVFRIGGVPVIPGVTGMVGPRERTHIGQSFAIPPARDGAVELGTIRLMKLDPENPSKGRVGISFGERDGKMVINAVMPETPAARAGLRAGDVLIAVDGKNALTDRSAAMTALRPEDPGKEIKLLVQTPGQEPRSVTVKRTM
jgi:protocatechuate 3,4-dioxygenase beta subunit